MKLLVNPHRKRTADTYDSVLVEKRIEQSEHFHKCLPGYLPTPCVIPASLAMELDLQLLLVKDESKRFGLKAFKGLGASFAIYNYLKILSGGGLTPDDFLTKGAEIAKDVVFTTATDGNHGRAVAWTAKLLKRPAVIYMPAGSAESRINAIKSEGAKVIVVDGSYDEAVRCASSDAAKYGRIVIADTGYEGYLDIPRYIQQGYLTLFAELREQIDGMNAPAPDFVFIQSGVGAFAAAAAEFFSVFYPEARLVSVEPLSADCLRRSAAEPDGRAVTVSGGGTIMAGLNCGTPSLTAWDIIKDSFYAFLAIEDLWAEKAMRLFAENGIVSGESGCAGLAALLALQNEYQEFFKDNTEKNRPVVLLISTEGDTDPVFYNKIV